MFSSRPVLRSRNFLTLAWCRRILERDFFFLGIPAPGGQTRDSLERVIFCLSSILSTLRNAYGEAKFLYAFKKSVIVSAMIKLGLVQTQQLITCGRGFGDTSCSEEI